MKQFAISILTILFILGSTPQTHAQTTPEQQTPAEQKIKIKVSGITCAGDCKDIQKSVEKLEGVKLTKQLSKASATTLFEITFNPALVSTKQIRQSVEDTPGCDDPKDRPYKVKQVTN